MPFLRSFIIDPRAHPDFYWVLITRLFVNMGVWSISTMLLFYAQDVVGLAHAANALPALLGIGAFLSIPASLVAVWMSARYGLIFIVQITSWIMVAATLCYVLVPFHPHFALFASTVLLFSLGWGAYQAVDWALALRVLPSAAGAGKDMGIWHIAFVLPLIIGPVVTGWMVSSLRLVVSAGTAYMAAFGIAALWFVLAAILIVRVRLRHAT
jgi:MFS family permease